MTTSPQKSHHCGLVGSLTPKVEGLPQLQRRGRRCTGTSLGVCAVNALVANSFSQYEKKIERIRLTTGVDLLVISYKTNGLNPGIKLNGVGIIPPLRPFWVSTCMSCCWWMHVQKVCLRELCSFLFYLNALPKDVLVIFAIYQVLRVKICERITNFGKLKFNPRSLPKF